VSTLDELVALRIRRVELDRREVELIEAALDEGETLTSMAKLYGFTPQAMGQRYRKLGGKRELSPGRPRKRDSPRLEPGAVCTEAARTGRARWVEHSLTAGESIRA